MSDQNEEALEPSERVARCLVFPQFRDPDSGAFDVTQFLRFVGPKKHSAMSVGWRRYLPETSDVHAYGCRTAEHSNVEKKRRMGTDPVPLNTASHYLGFSELEVEAIIAASNTAYEVRVVHAPEHGENAHCHIERIERQDLGKNFEKSSYRTAVVDRIARALGVIERHVCSGDAMYADDLNGVIVEI